MANSFFVAWQTWEKLVFLLACAIVITVCLGSLKLAYAHWRLHKYTKIAEKEKQEQTLLRGLDSETNVVQSPDGQGTPFGIRAIESGIEVEGVWVSHSNTPEPSFRGSASSLNLNTHPGQIDSPDLERGDHSRGQRRDSCKPIAEKRSPTRQTRHTIGHDDLTAEDTTTHGRIGVTDYTPTVRPNRFQRPPFSNPRYASAFCLPRISSTVSTIEGLDAIHHASSSLHSRPSDKSSSSGSRKSGNSLTDNDPIYAAAPRLLSGHRRGNPKLKNFSMSDFELLNSHRVTLAAETGQLTPRTPRATQPSTVEQTKPGHFRSASASASTEPLDYFTRRPQPLHSPHDTSAATPGLPPPGIADLPFAIRRSSLPDVTPFAQFCQTAPPSPRPEGYRPESAAATGPRPAEAPPIQPSNASTMPPSSTAIAAESPSFEKIEPKVLRGLGSGFEILEPGSLTLPPPAATSASRERDAVRGPPVSLHNFTRDRPGGGGGAGSTERTRLQKRRRSSQDSTKSP